MKKTIFNNRKRRRQCIFYICLIIIPLIQFFVMYVCVNLRSVLFAFQKYNYETGAYDFNFMYTIDNLKRIYEDLIANPAMWNCWRNSIIYYLFGLLVTTPVSLMMAYFVYKKTLFSKVFRVVLYLPSMVCGFATILSFKYIFSYALPNLFPEWEMLSYKGGLFTNPDVIFVTLTLYHAWIGLGGGLVMNMALMSRTSPELVEAAKIDGVNFFQEFRHIVWPVVYPVVTIGLYTGIVGIFAGGPPLYEFFGSNAPQESWTIGYYFFTKVVGSKATASEYPYAATANLLFTLIAVPIVLFLKYLFEKYDPNEERIPNRRKQKNEKE